MNLININKVVDVIFDLLNEYDRGLWDDIRHVDIADVWCEALDSEEFNEAVKIDRLRHGDDILKQKLKEFLVEKCKI